MSGPKSAILLLAHGSPDSPADVPEFMKHVTGGRLVADSVMKKSRTGIADRQVATHGDHHETGGSGADRSAFRYTHAIEAVHWRSRAADGLHGINKVVAICWPAKFFHQYRAL
jgi:protoheme ferro-lyase